jgi:hypothetical protein
MPYCITLRSRTDERIRVGMPAAGLADGPLTIIVESGSTTHTRPVPSAKNCATSARTTPQSSISKSPGMTVSLAWYSLNLAFRHRACRAFRSCDKGWA